MKNLTNVVSLLFLRRSLTLAMVIIAFMPELVSGQEFDQMYGSGPIPGIIIDAFSTQADEYYDLKLDNAGRAVCVGRSYDDPDEGFSYRILVTRRLPNGSFDSTFDGDGKAYIDRPANSDEAFSLEIQPDNKIVVAGKSGSYPLVARLNENGTLDNSFGNGGIAVLDQSNGSVVGGFNDLVIQPDGKIVAVGVVFTGINGNNEDYLVVRFNVNGQRDNLFDFDGIATYSVFDDDYPAALSIKLQTDGKYVIVGRSNRDGVTTDDATWARVNPNGTIDSGAAFGGTWASYATGDDANEDVLILPNGKSLTCGWGRLSSSDYYMILRLFSVSGTMENSWYYYALGEDDDRAFSLSLQCDGKILILGRANNQTTVIFRLNSDISLDPTFGVNGFVVSQIGYIDYPRAVRAYGDKIYVAGYILPNSNSFTNYDALVARIINTPIGSTPTITSSATTICPGGAPVTLTASGCTTCSVVWYLNGTLTGQTSNQITVTAAGTYTAAYQNGDCGTGSPSNAININAGTQPSSAIITPTGPVTSCTSVQLTATNVCSGCTVTWYKNNAPLSGQSGTILNATTDGTYHTIVSNGCPSQVSNQVTVDIVSPPVAANLTPPGPISICNGQIQTINANNVCSGCAVTWYQNGAPVSGQTGTSIQVTSPGIYTCTVSNGACNSPVSNQVLATTLQAAIPPTISTNVDETCTTATLTASNICPQCTVNWYSANGSFVGNGNTIQVPSGAYYARAKNSCPEESGQSNIISVNQAQFNATISVNNCTLCVPSGSNYAWYLNNQIIPGATSACWTATASGNYFVSMTDLNGCMGVTPLVFVSCISSVQAIEGISSLRVFPNPASEYVTFELGVNLPLDLNIQLFAGDGRQVAQIFQGVVSTGITEVKYPLKDFPAGTYYYRVTAENGVAAGSLAIGK